MVPPSLYTHLAALILGLFASWWVMDTRAEKLELKREKEAAEAVAKQEKKNAEITAEHVRDVQTIHLHYQHNPVRVFIPRGPGQSGGTACPDVTPKDIVLTVGGVKRSDGAKAP